MLEGDPQGPVPSVVGAADPLIGRILNDRFRILSPLGSGGMGKVYKAVQTPLDRVVALKILKPEHASNRELTARFLREARVASTLVHPNVVTVYEVGRWRDHPYVAMEYVPGGTARSWLAKQPRAPRERSRWRRPGLAPARCSPRCWTGRGRPAR